MKNKEEKEENKEEVANLKGFMQRVFNETSDKEYIAQSMRIDIDEDPFAAEKALAKLQK